MDGPPEPHAVTGRAVSSGPYEEPPPGAYDQPTSTGETPTMPTRIDPTTTRVMIDPGRVVARAHGIERVLAETGGSATAVAVITTAEDTR
ncbi:hypothetical protein [Streptomyces sp. NPDC059466]|uniref:hypothetical protein n=1 Tax=unclassified Streptomyces TaxID=2593676 RepID=UPI0036CE0603